MINEQQSAHVFNCAKRIVTPPPLVCAWCPDFVPSSVNNAGVSHGICPSCAAKMNAAIDVMER